MTVKKCDYFEIRRNSLVKKAFVIEKGEIWLKTMFVLQKFSISGLCVCKFFKIKGVFFSRMPCIHRQRG